MAECAGGSSDQAIVVQLTESDIPGALLSEPINRHTMPALRWWLLCRGIRAPTSWNKQKVLSRIQQAKSEQLPIVDVDGSYLHRKQQSLIQSGVAVAPLDLPLPPLSGWEVVTEGNIQTIAPNVPVVTSGTLYTYLACGAGCSEQQRAFRALTRGYTHWSSGRLDQLQVNTVHPRYCHVRCTTTPSMKPGVYHVYLLLGRVGEVASIETATCGCAAGKSASCTHVSAVLHALVAMTTTRFRLQPTLPSTSLPDGDDEVMPVTSYLCQWKVPKKRKESNLPMSAAVFEKHDYRKQKKRKICLMEDFDPRPIECRGTVMSLLPTLLANVRDESLGVSLLFDPRYCHPTVPFADPGVPDIPALKDTVKAFKDSLKLSADKLREIEQNTREQRQSSLWFSVRRYRITASRFGEILRRKPDTAPDALVLSILQPCSFSSAATEWGTTNEPLAIKAYLSYQQQQGHYNLTVGPCGFLVSETHPFLGATPDGTVYDPSNLEQPFGFIEVKCPYSHRDRTPLEASSFPGFCCSISSNGQMLHIRHNHPYYAQVQGQMAVGNRPWCDFVIFTNKGISVERVAYDDDYWQNTLLPKLEFFFDNCLGPEIVSPMHALGFPIRDLSK